MSVSRSFKSFFPAIGWAIILVYLSATPGIQLPTSSLFEVDKLAHMVAYAIFTALILYGYWLYLGKQKLPWVPVVVVAFSIASGWGFLMELMQYGFFKGRTFDIYDEFANISGSILSIGIFKLLLKL